MIYILFKQKTPHLLLFTLIVAIGCQEVVNVEVPNEEPRLVIEGKLTDAPKNNCEVKIAETVNYYQKSTHNPVKDARVTITDNSGNTYPLTLEEDSIYRNHQIEPEVGDIYTLNVDYKGEAYEATSAMYPHAQVDSIVIKYRPKRPFNEEGFVLYFNGVTPQSKEINYFRFLVYKNDSLFNEPEDYLLFSDEFTNDTIRNLELPFSFDPRDSVTLEMYSLNKDVFEYFQQLQNLLFNDGGLFSPPPENPTSNIINLSEPDRNQLGYFQVSGFVQRKLVMPQEKPATGTQ